MKTPTAAGAELDALIAEKVFGLRRIANAPYTGAPIVIDDKTAIKFFLKAYSSGTRLTDACGLVVEAMEKKGWDFILYNFPSDPAPEGKCHATFQRGDDDPTQGQAFAPTPPHAICLAALAALEKENPPLRQPHNRDDR